MIPAIIWGISIAGGAYGVKRGLDAKEKYNEIKKIIERIKKEGKNLEEKLCSTNEELESLNQLKRELAEGTLKRAIKYLENHNQLSYLRQHLSNTGQKENLPTKDFTSKSAAATITSILQGTMKGVASRQMAMYIAKQIGVASTGTAIKTLSGAAAERAALSWLGGGALEAGGGGLALGTTLLSGLSLGVGILFTGISLDNKMAQELEKMIRQEREIIGKYKSKERELDTIVEKSHLLKQKLNIVASRLERELRLWYFFKSNRREIIGTLAATLLQLVNLDVIENGEINWSFDLELESIMEPIEI
ncbi:MAG: hypothetical protein GXO19_04130 [Epsilonproteobacteria bacterium]|nr:hypothetical protein [Campylobacterota bacterium]NPA56910.1 hypothetical protein [Campylobacterota bacterium]